MSLLEAKRFLQHQASAGRLGPCVTARCNTAFLHLGSFMLHVRWSLSHGNPHATISFSTRTEKNSSRSFFLKMPSTSNLLNVKGGIAVPALCIDIMGDNRNQRTKSPVLHGVAKARFPGWSSEQAHVDFVYRPATSTRGDKISIVRAFGQRKAGDPSGKWYKPYFPPVSMKQLLEYGRKRHAEGYAKRTKAQDQKQGRLKGHKVGLCEKCSGA